MVFDWPEGLPLQRARDHAIVLQPGAVPMSVRPYQLSLYPKK